MLYSSNAMLYSSNVQGFENEIEALHPLESISWDVRVVEHAMQATVTQVYLNGTE
jgi:hypothetical protein